MMITYDIISGLEMNKANLGLCHLAFFLFHCLLYIQVNWILNTEKCIALAVAW